MPRPRLGQDDPPIFTPPRPLWQIREELEVLKSQRPSNRDILALTSWNLACERLQMWSDLDPEINP